MNDPMTDDGKRFAGFYALYAGLFIFVLALMLAPRGRAGVRLARGIPVSYAR